MLLVRQPFSCAHERRYALDVLLGEFLGLPCQYKEEPGHCVRITCPDAPSPAHLQWPDTFFQTRAGAWLAPESLPRDPTPVWKVSQDLPEAVVAAPTIPVLYGEPLETGAWFAQSDRGIRLGVDIAGSAFFMLTRYEEAVVQIRDAHDRFPAHASLAYRQGFLLRPIVDEYTEILWAALHRLWPHLTRKARHRAIFVTCDVDMPFKYQAKLSSLFRHSVGDLIRRRNPRLVLDRMEGYAHALKGYYSDDPWYAAINWIMSVNEKAGNRVAFFLMADGKHKWDGHYSLESPPVRQLLRRIHERGHEIGFHPGYATYLDPDETRRQADVLRRIMKRESIRYHQLGGRQHFLRWRTPDTARNWEAAGLSYDSTLGYADHVGFRCGTSREYTLYDVVLRRRLNVKERPLILMDCSLVAERYMGLGYTDEALAYAQTLKERALRIGGFFTLLWHNSFLDQPEARRFYSDLIHA